MGARLLEPNTSVPDNASIHVASVSRVGAGDNARLKLDVELSSATTLGGDVTVDVYINDPSVDANATPVRNFELGEVSGPPRGERRVSNAEGCRFWLGLCGANQHG